MLEVGCSVLDVPFSPLAVRGSHFASGVRHPSDMRDFHAATAFRPSAVSLASVTRPGEGGRRTREPESYLPGVSGACPARVPGDSRDSPRLPASVWLVKLRPRWPASSVQASAQHCAILAHWLRQLGPDSAWRRAWPARGLEARQCLQRGGGRARGDGTACCGVTGAGLAHRVGVASVADREPGEGGARCTGVAL